MAFRRLYFCIQCTTFRRSCNVQCMAFRRLYCYVPCMAFRRACYVQCTAFRRLYCYVQCTAFRRACYVRCTEFRRAVTYDVQHSEEHVSNHIFLNLWPSKIWVPWTSLVTFLSAILPILTIKCLRFLVKTLKAGFFYSCIRSKSSASMPFYSMIPFLPMNETDGHFKVFSQDFKHSGSLLPGLKKLKNNNNCYYY